MNSKIDSTALILNYNNEINRYIKNHLMNIRNNYKNTNKKEIYLNTYLIPLMYLLFSNYYSKYYYLNKKILYNDYYINKINNLNIMYNYNNPIINDVNTKYYKYFNSINKSNKSTNVLHYDDIFDLKKKILEKLKGINKIYLMKQKEKTEITSKIITLEKNKNSTLLILFDNLKKLDKNLGINTNSNFSLYNKIQNYIKSHNRANTNNKLKSNEFRFLLNSNIINFIDDIITPDNYFKNKKGIDQVKLNIYKILDLQNNIEILNIENKFYKEINSNIRDKYQNILNNYKNEKEIYEEFLSNYNTNNKNTLKVKKEIFKEEIQKIYKNIDESLVSVENSVNNNNLDSFLKKYLFESINIENNFESQLIKLEFNEKIDNTKILNNDLKELKKFREQFKIDYRKIKKINDSDNNSSNKLNNLKQLNKNEYDISKNINEINEKIKDNNTSKNKNYQYTKNKIANTEIKLKTLGNIDSRIDDLKKNISDTISVSSFGSDVSFNNNNTKYSIEQKINEAEANHPNYKTDKSWKDFKFRLLRLIDNYDKLKKENKEKKELTNKQNNLRKTLISYDIKKIALESQLEFYTKEKKFIEDKKKIYNKLDKNLKSENFVKEKENIYNEFIEFFNLNIELTTLISNIISSLKFKKHGNKIYFLYTDDTDLINIEKSLNKIKDNIDLENINNLKLNITNYLSNTKNKDKNISKNIFINSLMKINSKLDNEEINSYLTDFKKECESNNKTLKKIIKHDLNNMNSNKNDLKSTITKLINKINKLNTEIIKDNANKNNFNKKISKNAKTNNKEVVFIYPYTNTFKLYLTLMYTVIIILSNFK